MKALKQFLRTSGLGRLGLALASFLLVVALAAPWIAPYDPSAQNLAVAADRAERASLDGHGRTGPRYFVAHHFRDSRIHAGERIGGAWERGSWGF